MKFDDPGIGDAMISEFLNHFPAQTKNEGRVLELSLDRVQNNGHSWLAEHFQRPEIICALPDFASPRTGEDSDAWLVRIRQDGGDAYRLSHHAKAEVDGCIALVPHESGHPAVVFWVVPEAWNRGLGTSIVQGLADRFFARTKIAAFSAECFIDNPAAKRILDQVGFVRSGGTTRFCPARGTSLPTDVFYLDRTGWIRGASRFHPRLTTPQLVLRPWVPDDRDSLIALVDPDVARVVSDFSFPCTSADVLKRLECWVRYGRPPAPMQYCEFAIERDGVLVGEISASLWGKEPSIGWWLGKAHRGRGIVPEAARAVLALMFERGLPEVGCRTAAWNKASIRVIQKLGFEIRHSDSGEITARLTREMFEAGA